MRIGVTLPNPYGPSRESVLTVAHAAERLGYDSLWTNSHMAVPVAFAPRYPYNDTGVPPWNATSTWIDAMTLMAFAAAATERVRIGVAVVQASARRSVLGGSSGSHDPRPYRLRNASPTASQIARSRRQRSGAVSALTE